jgi:hypothetical protein
LVIKEVYVIRITVPNLGFATKIINTNACLGASGEERDTIGGGKIGIKEKINIYPNPTSNLIHISSTEPSNTLEIHDIQGKLMLQTSGKPDLTLDINQIESGIYLLTVYSNHIPKHFKIIKQ